MFHILIIAEVTYSITCVWNTRYIQSVSGHDVVNIYESNFESISNMNIQSLCVVLFAIPSVRDTM